MFVGPVHKTVQISTIPVERRGDRYFSIPLWTTDINAGVRLSGEMHLLCPIRDIGDPGLGPIDDRITITDSTNLTVRDLEEIVRHADVLEVPGNFGWRETALSRWALTSAHRQGKIAILGISSNRARTVVMNAQGAGFIKRLRAVLKSWDIRLTQRFMARRCDGVRVVGYGLVPLVERQARSLHVETASWISEKDLHLRSGMETAPARVAMASRLEPMKGVAVGVRAVADVVARGRQVGLQIIGQGPEEESLRQLVAQLGLSKITRFSGQLSYPDAFFEAMRTSDFVLLTNLNDEQPRLIFDAISRGAIPVCPRTEVYVNLGLDDRILYEQGNSRALSDTLSKMLLLAPTGIQELREALMEIARLHTIESMHARRRDWVHTLLQARDTTDTVKDGAAP